VPSTEQLTIDREVPLGTRTEERRAAERAARESLRAQVAKLERELSEIVTRGFPHIAPPLASVGDAGIDLVGRSPRLLSLAELERARDRLVVCVRRAQAQLRDRAELELRSRDLLERMRLEPGRYRFVRLRVADLGERGCGVWEVRPRLGLIGMLAGWWQLKLSSGCPLPGPRAYGARRLALRRCTTARARIDTHTRVWGMRRHALTPIGATCGRGARQKISSPLRRTVRDKRGGRAPSPRRVAPPLTG